jgi:hypothetical protein
MNLVQFRLKNPQKPFIFHSFLLFEVEKQAFLSFFEAKYAFFEVFLGVKNVKNGVLM